MSTSRLAYAPGLDGVRALAVTAVLVYHLGTTGLRTTPTPGGFLGVDVFFVLSGFLITSLLLAEHSQTGGISIRAFYVRRARRLLPALYVMLAVVAVAAAFVYPADAARLRGDLVAALTYVTNWWLIVGHTSYFGAGVHPPLLTHMWSLAVEEQFYLLWPLFLVALTRLRRRGMALAVVAVLIVTSTLLAALLYDPYGDPSRIYYGTDTRAATPLLGALLAIAFRPWLWRGRLRPGRRLALDTAGVAAALLLGIFVANLGDHSAFLYRGGFLVVAVLAGALVLAAAHQDSMIGRVLGTPPLRWLGERSYAIYLWHWPVLAVTQPGIDLSIGQVPTTILRVVLTLLLADLSYRFVEKPMRAGALRRGVETWRTAWRASSLTQRSARTATASAVGLVAVVAFGFVGTQLASANQPASAPVGPGPDTSLGALPAPAVSSRTSSAAPKPSSSATKLAIPKVVPHVAIFGDSQGMTLLLNVPKDTSKYVKFKDDTIEGCGVLLGKVSSRSGEKRNLSANCPNWLPEWASRAKRDKPDIGLVMIGAWDVFNTTTGGRTLTFGTPDWDANFTHSLDQGIAAIHSSGAQVALALVPCFRPIKASAGFWPERGDDDRTRHVNTLLEAAAAAEPGYVSTVNPPHQFCDNKKIATSLSYRWDGVHYYKPGALLYVQAVIPQLLAIAAAER